MIKCRRFVLPIPLDVSHAGHVRHGLFEMMGIQKVRIDGDKVAIQYDLIQATADKIANELAMIGDDLRKGWKNCLNFAFINYLEECEIGNLEVDSKKRMPLIRPSISDYLGRVTWKLPCLKEHFLG